MKLNDIQLEYKQKGGFKSTSFDGIRHIKTLPYLSVVQAVEGNYDIQLGNGKVHNTGKGGFFIAPPNIQQTIIHNADKSDKNMICRWVFLKIKINELYDLSELYDFPVILPDDYKNQMNILFNRLFEVNNLFDEYICYYEIIKILSLISQNKEYKPSQHIDKALIYIADNYKNKISIRDISKEITLSESRLFSLFKNEMGVSPITYLNNYRLSVAADMLLKTHKTITEVADAVGIGDSIYFNKLFRRAYQMAPSKYRKTYKSGRE